MSFVYNDTINDYTRMIASFSITNTNFIITIYNFTDKKSKLKHSF